MKGLSGSGRAFDDEAFSCTKIFNNSCRITIEAAWRMGIFSFPLVISLNSLCINVIEFNNLEIKPNYAIFYVTVATVSFSHWSHWCFRGSPVKMACYFHMWRFNVFARKITWFSIGVYIIKHCISCYNIWPYTKFKFGVKMFLTRRYCYLNRSTTRLILYLYKALSMCQTI